MLHLLHGRRTPGDRDGRGQKAAPHRRELRGLPAVYAGLPDRLDNPQQTGEEARKMIGEEGVVLSDYTHAPDVRDVFDCGGDNTFAQ